MAYTTPRTWTTGETPTATIMNTHVRDNMSYVYAPDDAWTAVTLNASPAYGSLAGSRALSYRIVAGSRVQLRGTVTIPTNYGAIGTANDVNSTTPLAAGYRPSQLRVFAVGTSDSVSGRLDITTTGLIRFRPGTAACSWFSADGIEWDINN